MVTLTPKPLETVPGNAGIVRRVLGIPVAEVIQHGPEIGALISQVVAAGVAQHVGPSPAKLCLLDGQAHDVVDGLAGQLGLTLREEQPGQIVLAGGQVAFDGAQLVARYRVLDGQRALERLRPKRERLTPSWSRRIPMASETRRPCR
jgi:hypothetical protein